MPAPVPDAGKTLSQAPLVTVAVQFRVSPPETEMGTVWLAGFAPAMVMNRSEGGSAMEGPLSFNVLFGPGVRFTEELPRVPEAPVTSKV